MFLHARFGGGGNRTCRLDDKWTLISIVVNAGEHSTLVTYVNGVQSKRYTSELLQVCGRVLPRAVQQYCTTLHYIALRLRTALLCPVT